MTQSRHEATRSLDHLVGALLEMQGHVKSERSGRLDIDDQLELGRPLQLGHSARELLRFDHAQSRWRTKTGFK
jgi:hypothetical protein